jgi:hypothetical protein
MNMAASDAQVQQFVNERVRPWSEQCRALYLAAKDHKAAIDDTYAALAQPSPTWSDDRSDAPPHLMTPADVLAWNAFVTAFVAFVEGDANYAKIQQACVQPVRA